MQLTSFLVAAILPLGLMAAPAVEGRHENYAPIHPADNNMPRNNAKPAPPQEDGTDDSHMPRDDYAPILAPDETEVADPGKELFARANQRCSIVGAAEVNCRSGPGTGYKVKYTLPKGARYLFSCFKTGECITVNGATNCGWDWLPDGTCYINGHYTDSSCTAAKLGRCNF